MMEAYADTEAARELPQILILVMSFNNITLFDIEKYFSVKLNTCQTLVIKNMLRMCLVLVF